MNVAAIVFTAIVVCVLVWTVWTEFAATKKRNR